MTLETIVFGDPHGDFRPVKRMASEIDRDSPPLCIFMGDYDLEVQMDVALRPLTDLGCRILFITGNHEADRENWYRNVFDSDLAEGCIDTKVVEIDGVRIAGLGGVFKGRIWNPNDGRGWQKFRSRDAFLYSKPSSRWEGGVPLGLRAAIFPEDYDALSELEADVLVTHEAPTSHRYGFSEIDTLAEVMGVKAIIHGHHHEAYEGEIDGGIKVFGTGKADTLRLDLGVFRPGLSPSA